MKMQSLNVGCGSDSWGDIRVDIAFNFISIRCKPTILADAQYLPFRDGSFKIVKASHVLEHLEEPFKALDELLRVTKEDVVLSFPTELDVWGWILPNIFPIPRFSLLKFAFQTMKNKLHLWIISPKIIMDYLRIRGWKSNCVQNTYSVFAFFEGGRKADYFKWLTKRFRIPFEYAILARPIQLIENESSIKSTSI